MALLNVGSIQLKNSESRFGDKIEMDIKFEAFEALKDDVEWRVIYVGSAYDPSKDQTLESVVVGPIQQGIHSFTLDVPAPNPAIIPEDDLIGATVVLLTAHYFEQEFLRVGWYVNVDYDSEELRDHPPTPPDPTRLVRSILHSQPRVTRMQINWNGPAAAPAANGDQASGPAPPAPQPVANGSACASNDDVNMGQPAPAPEISATTDPEPTDRPSGEVVDVQVPANSNGSA